MLKREQCEAFISLCMKGFGLWRHECPSAYTTAKLKLLEGAKWIEKSIFKLFVQGRWSLQKSTNIKNNYPKWPTTGPYGPFRSVGRGAIQAGDDGRWPIAAHHYTIRTVGVTSTNDIERSTVTQEKTKHANASNRWHRILKYVNPCWTELLYSLLVNM